MIIAQYIIRVTPRTFRNVCLLIIFVTLSGCGEEPYSPTDLAATWADMTLRITRDTPANSPTYASRCLGYVGLTMYESVVHSDSSYRSLAGQLSDLDALPLPEPGKQYNWPIVLNEGQATILKSLYNQTSDENKQSIDSLKLAINNRLSEGISASMETRSVVYGKKLADAIFEWSQGDGGHRAYLKNFDKDWVHPEHQGKWQPPLFAQSFSHHPLHPHWGDNRTFVPADSTIAPPKFLAYDTLPGSPYYEQFRQVYEAERALTQEQKEMAIWWGDDPDETFTPPGHSYFLATQLLRDRQPGLVESARTYAATGMAVADAFIDCWKWKFHFFSERPNTFIPRYIDEEWESFWPDPPFPSFPSGHAIQSGAAMSTLIDLHGNDFTFTDRSHLGRPRDVIRDVDFPERHFTNLWAVALETADSRFYGGIHLPIDNEAGLEKGREIADNVAGLEWRR